MIVGLLFRCYTVDDGHDVGDVGRVVVVDIGLDVACSSCDLVDDGYDVGDIDTPVLVDISSIDGSSRSVLLDDVLASFPCCLDDKKPSQAKLISIFLEGLKNRTLYAHLYAC